MQPPEEHESLDLRLTEIEYLPRLDPRAPQQFLSAAHFGLGLRISSTGESIRGERRE